MRFSVEVRDIAQHEEQKTEVEIYLDKEGLEDLLRQLGFLKNPGDHCHFMTPAWGGHELTEDKSDAGNVLINHLRITLVGEEQSKDIPDSYRGMNEGEPQEAHRHYPG